MARAAEVRWFFQGALPAWLPAWFAGTATLPTEPARTDRYLLLPRNEASGMKIREGRLELKTRVGGPVEVGWGPVVGRVEEWDRWPEKKPTLTESERALLALVAEHHFLPHGAWREVKKERVVRRLAREGTFWMEAPPDARITHGGKAEYVALTVPMARGAAERWWSLAFDAGGAGDTREHVAGAVRAFLGRRAPLPQPFTAAASMGYPQWLDGLGV
jgi:hypothetical protein